MIVLACVLSMLMSISMPILISHKIHSALHQADQAASGFVCFGDAFTASRLSNDSFIDVTSFVVKVYQPTFVVLLCEPCDVAKRWGTRTWEPTAFGSTRTYP